MAYSQAGNPVATAPGSDMPAIEPGVSEALAKWRAVNYSDVRYKLNLTLEKMSPVLKGTIEIRLQYAAVACAEPDCPPMYIMLDWRKLPGHEKDSTISNVTINGGVAVLSSKVLSSNFSWPDSDKKPTKVGTQNAEPTKVGTQNVYYESNEHLIFRDGVRMGENVINLDFTSPILTSGSAITRYIDKEDGAEYIYSLFVPSDASTAFPVFDQPDLKARFTLSVMYPKEWLVISNTSGFGNLELVDGTAPAYADATRYRRTFEETKPISTYLFAFAAGPFANFREDYKDFLVTKGTVPTDPAERRGFIASFEIPKGQNPSFIFVRRSQAAKFKPHAAEVFRLNREGVKFLETYFDYKFPFPKYDIVLIPEFPFGGMEHAGATFLREDRVIFPQEPTANDYITRANVIFHEAAHQWFGDTVTMKWFDDLWLKEGFAEFMAYKTLEKVMPQYNAWKVFYERNKQAAYLTDSTKGTTPIYQEIDNLSAAKSAYGNIVYRKAPSFLRQAEFYLGEDKSFGVREDKFQTAVRAFLKKHEFANAGWEDLVKEFEIASGKDLRSWANRWIKQRGVPIVRFLRNEYYSLRKIYNYYGFSLSQSNSLDPRLSWPQTVSVFESFPRDSKNIGNYELEVFSPDTTTLDPKIAEKVKLKEVPIEVIRAHETISPNFVFANYKDYGYGIFLLDDKSRDYVLKNIQNEKDDFLRTMMWGSLWDSVREGELDPKDYVELAIKNLGGEVAKARASGRAIRADGPTESDEMIIQSLLSRVSTALNYYIPRDIALANARASATGDLRSRFEALLIDRMQNAPTAGQRITYYRAFVNIAASDEARGVLRTMLSTHSRKRGLGVSTGISGLMTREDAERILRFEKAMRELPLKTKDKFDIVTRLAILGDPDAPKLLADLEKSETSDEAKRYAYAAHAAFATKENRAKYWNEFVNNKDISESWIEAAIGPFNSIRHDELSLPYLERALAELPSLKRTRKIFFINNWLGAFIGGQRSEDALKIVNKFLADNPTLDKDLRLKILENVDLIERAVKIRAKYGKN